MTANEFVTVAQVGSIAEGSAKSFLVGEAMVAVFHQDGKYHAISDVCPHMGASLATGHVEDGMVTCPWHAWRFKITDGTWCDNPRIKIDAYEVRVEGNDIQVRALTPECEPERD
jgi:nitrite reductase (NADH) small subunit